MTTEQNIVAATRLIELYNQGTADWVKATHHLDSQWREMPTSSYPNGRGGNRTVLQQAAEEAVQVFPDRQIEILNSVPQDDQVTMQALWTGTVAAEIPGWPKGTRVTINIAFFFRFQDGLVISQTDYACLEPIDP
ncbi:MAG: hypothetical protein E2O92_08800 [Alphaproteobacteria bacterium]|nr:MAG: hypothetical protein E2O92_08800 [Alphaproteobacteria bacterium]